MRQIGKKLDVSCPSLCVVAKMRRQILGLLPKMSEGKEEVGSHPRISIGDAEGLTSNTLRLLPKLFLEEKVAPHNVLHISEINPTPRQKQDDVAIAHHPLSDKLILGVAIRNQTIMIKVRINTQKPKKQRVNTNKNSRTHHHADAHKQTHTTPQSQTR